MPELAEVRIMSEYINEVSEGRIFRNIRKSTVSKVKTSMKNPFEDLFKIEALSRGKELRIEFLSRDGRKVPMTFSMGMSGFWQMVPSGAEPKHAHFMMDSTDGHTLCLVDVRRFAKWKWGDWNHGRGPDPTRDFELFRKHILENIDHKSFSSPICSVMMNQSWFNGIGNYLRSTILYRAEQNPFESAREAILKNSSILELCEKIPMEAYYLAGGQLKDWENPFGKKEEKVSFREWVFYYKGISCVDESGRRFWFDPKWRSECPYEIKE